MNTVKLHLRVMKEKPSKPRVFVHLTAFWGNDDVDSTIKVSRRRWQAIREGAEYETSRSYWYEGAKYSATWSFANGKVTIRGDDGMECVISEPVESLLTEIIPSDQS